MPTIADATDRSTIEQLVQAVEDLQETATRQANRINDPETELAEHKDHTGREFAAVRARVTNTETEIETIGDTVSDADSNAGNGNNTGPETDVRNNDTPLKTICSFTEYFAARELTANQERARFIAKDMRDYAEKCLLVSWSIVARSSGSSPPRRERARIRKP